MPLELLRPPWNALEQWILTTGRRQADFGPVGKPTDLTTQGMSEHLRTETQPEDRNLTRVSVTEEAVLLLHDLVGFEDALCPPATDDAADSVE